MAVFSESVGITSEALAERARESGPTKTKLWADVMSELSDSTDAPDHRSLEESEANAGHSGGESAVSSDDGAKQGQRRRAATPLTLGSAGFSPLSPELRLVVAQLHMFLYNCPWLARVHLQEGGLGSPTTITAEIADRNLKDTGTKEQWILEPARQALATAAQSSQSVYMIGYDGEAFENFFGEGFKATLGIPNEEDDLCWDTWQWGYCSRPGSCRCKHPHKQELMEISVVLRRAKQR